MYTTTISRKKDFHIFSLEQWLVLFLLFLSAMNFINKYYYFAFAAFVLVYLIRLDAKIDKSAICLIILTLSFLFFSDGTRDKFTSMLKPFLYPMAYVVGRIFCKKSSEERCDNGTCSQRADNNRLKQSEKQIVVAILILALGLFVHFMLNFLISRGSEDRNNIDFWTQSVLSATGQAAIAVLPISLIFACLLSDMKIIFKLIAFVALICLLGYNLILAGRMLFALAIILAIVAVGFLLLFGDTWKNKLKIIIPYIILLVILLFAYVINFFGLKEMVQNSNFFDRFFGNYGQDISSDSRLDLKWMYLQNLEKSIFGGASIRNLFQTYAHDLFLDTYDEAGIFALVAVIVYIVFSLKRLYKCLINRAISFQFRQIILCVYLGFYIEFLLEPILIGMQWMFCFFCLIDGLLASYLKTLTNGNKEIKCELSR